MQSAAAVMIRTSSERTAAMYGFGFGGPEVGKMFDEALRRVQQSLKPNSHLSAASKSSILGFE